MTAVNGTLVARPGENVESRTRQLRLPTQLKGEARPSAIYFVGGAFRPSWVSDSAKLATHLSQIRSAQ